MAQPTLNFKDWLIHQEASSFQLPQITSEDLERFPSQSQWDMSSFLKCLHGDAEKILPALMTQARKFTRMRFGNTLTFYVPLYLSNTCNSVCLYCGFSKNRKIARKTLSYDEMEANFSYLKERGFDQILLLTGEAPIETGVDYLAEAIRRAKKYFGFVAIEVFPMDVKDYRRMVEAGADGLTLYQETYHPEVYRKMHLAGEKKDYNYRLEAPERALAAGFRKIGIGVLLGLADWHFDVAMLAHHAMYLQKKYWRSEIVLSFPRINPEGILSRVPRPVRDRDLVQIITALRLLLPDVGFVLSTRERSELRDCLLDLAITQVSAESKTNPGGYLKEDSGEQFSIADHRPLEDLVKVARAKGLDPVFHDWSDEFYGDARQPLGAGMNPGNL